MEPFAYQKKTAPDRRKFVLMALAGASFSIWYFDLVPELAPVSTGQVETDPLNPDLTADDFIALLEATPDDGRDVELTATELKQRVQAETPVFDLLEESASADPLLTTPPDDSESLESAFPEFADVQPVANVQQSLGESTPAGGGVRQASFESSQSPELTPLVKETVLSADVADHLNDIDRWIEQGETLEAHAALSRMYWKDPELRMHLQPRLNKTSAEIYANPTRHFADPYMVQFGETLDGIAKAHNVPWQYLARLNRVSAKTLQAGQQLKVLKGPFAAVVDLQDKRLTLHAHGWYVRSYTVGIGRDHSTPTGEFAVKEKLENPTWYNPAGGVVDGDDPSNPLGEYWIGLGNHIGIHGTIDPESIGGSVSQGCIHLADDDITEVFQLLGEGSPVVIR